MFVYLYEYVTCIRTRMQVTLHDDNPAKADAIAQVGPLERVLQKEYVECLGQHDTDLHGMPMDLTRLQPGHYWYRARHLNPTTQEITWDPWDTVKVGMTRIRNREQLLVAGRHWSAPLEKLAEHPEAHEFQLCLPPTEKWA